MRNKKKRPLRNELYVEGVVSQELVEVDFELSST